jgi:hypothetical protein
VQQVAVQHLKVAFAGFDFVILIELVFDLYFHLHSHFFGLK